MKKIIILFVLFCCSVYSQNISGKAEYILKLSEEEFKKQVLSDSDMDPDMKKFLENKMKEKLQKRYVLNFNKSLSVYQEEEVLVNNNSNNSNNSNGSNGSWSPYGIDLKIFIDLKKKKIVIKKDLMSKYFYVEEELVEYDWVLLNETKKIGVYDCNSAMVVIKASKEELDDYELELDEFARGKTNLIKPVKPEDKIVKVWYAVDLPFIHGPDKYSGLPGLILEVHDGKNIILCTKLTLSSENIEIDIPNSGDFITIDNYNKIVDRKLKELEAMEFK